MSDTNVPRRGPVSGTARVVLGESLAATDVNAMIIVKAGDGEAYKGAKASGNKVVGINCNGETDFAEGDYIVVSQGEFLLTNSTTSALTAAHIGGLCYLEDAYTVASAATNSVVAGTVKEVVTEGVWVAVGIGNEIAAGS